MKQLVSMPIISGSSTLIPLASQPLLLLDTVEAGVQPCCSLAQPLERIGGKDLEDQPTVVVDLGAQDVALVDTQPTPELGRDDHLGSLPDSDGVHLKFLSDI